MAISTSPSKFSLPQINPGVDTVFEYLSIKFPRIEPELWRQRMSDGKVHWENGELISPDSAFQAQRRVFYYREVEQEPCIPFAEQILFQDEHLLVAFKPHFLAVTPGGIYVNECLQNRLRLKTGNSNLQALHRLDRATAGLVMFSLNPDTRHLYHTLFETGQIQKTYLAVAEINAATPLVGQEWEIKNRLENSNRQANATVGFLMQVVTGEPNSHTQIRCIEQSADKALFELQPITGKTHQLRVHMQTLGWPLLNDRYYPSLQTASPDDYTKPLQLLAKQLSFIDPITELPRVFSCENMLTLR